MENINVRSNNMSSVANMKKLMQDPNNIILAAILHDECGACVQFKPVWNSTINQYMSSRTPTQKKKKLILATIQSTTTDDLDIHNIRGYPTIRLIKNKQTMDEKLGGLPEHALIEHINKIQPLCKTEKMEKSKSKTIRKKKSRSKNKSKSKKNRKSKSKTKKGKLMKGGRKSKRNCKTRKMKKKSKGKGRKKSLSLPFFNFKF